MASDVLSFSTAKETVLFFRRDARPPASVGAAVSPKRRFNRLDAASLPSAADGKWDSELLAAITVLLLFGNPCDAFLSAFEPWSDLQCLTEIVHCRIELAKRLVGLATPA